MRPILTAAQMRLCDQYTIDCGTPSRTLMERAACAAIAVMKQELPLDFKSRVLVLCGSGNNGGDGFAMARFLRDEGYDTTVCYAGTYKDGLPDPDRMSTECARQYDLWQASGGMTIDTLPPLTANTLIADALLGIGLDRPVTGKLAEWIEAINTADLPTLAVDIPSGICADTGHVLGCAVKARATATMAYPKTGLLLCPGSAYAGKICTCDIGIGLDALSKNSADTPGVFEVTPADLAPLLDRPAYANKGTFGRVLVVGGASGMCGAAYFAAQTAYRAGAGLCEVMTHPDNRIPMQTLLPEAVFSPWTTDEALLVATLDRADAVVLGCGLGQLSEALTLTERIVRLCQKPLVLDADALNLLAAHKPLQDAVRARKHTTVLTPHLGEASRLSGLKTNGIASDMLTVSRDLAKTTNSTCILKDARTVISDGTSCYIQSHGNSGMATGGSGDCLAGLVGSLLAQHRNRTDLSPAHLAAFSVLLHAMAGDTAADALGQHAVMASDIADTVGKILHGLASDKS